MHVFLVPCDQRPDDEGEDASVAPVANFDLVIDTRAGGEALDPAVVACGRDLEVLPRLDAFQAADRVALVPAQAERLGALAWRELQWQDAHAHKVRAVNALEALRDYGAYAEQERTLGSPVA